MTLQAAAKAGISAYDTSIDVAITLAVVSFYLCGKENLSIEYRITLICRQITVRRIKKVTQD